MKNKFFNQRICCHVKKCKYYDQMTEKCHLGSITVGNKNASCENFLKNDYK